MAVRLLAALVVMVAEQVAMAVERVVMVGEPVVMPVELVVMAQDPVQLPVVMAVEPLLRVALVVTAEQPTALEPVRDTLPPGVLEGTEAVATVVVPDTERVVHCRMLGTLTVSIAHCFFQSLLNF